MSAPSLNLNPHNPAVALLLDAVAWARANLFSSWGNSLLTILFVWIAYEFLGFVLDWAVFSATWSGTSGADCRQNHGACWPFVFDRWNFFLYGRYPAEDYWRVQLTAVIGLLAFIPALFRATPKRGWFVLFLLVVYPFIAFFLLSGGFFGLEFIDTSRWGGLLVTVVLAVIGIAVSLPFGVLLALGRQSSMPIIQWMSIGFIEFWRGVPLITVLFMASVMLPLFLPEGVNFDKFLRCIIAVSLFASAYMAEVVRGGLQAIPRGQYEGAAALGLSFWKTTRLIVLPQALRHVIPGIVNSFIGLFKDTTLVLIVGLFDLLGVVQNQLTDPTWSAPTTHYTGYVVVAAIFWVFCFSMSRYSQAVERNLQQSHDR